MSKQQILSLNEIKQLDLDDFLKTSNDQQFDDVSLGDHLCQNPNCECENPTEIHVYEIDADRRVIICDHCYDSGYRFCIFTLDVLPISQLDPVLDNMYAQPQRHMNQLEHDVLAHVDDLYQYLKIIGIDNPNPEHILCKVDHFEQI